MSTYFITGATGVVGSAVAREVLRRDGTRLRLLIRARSENELGERLRVLLRFWEMDEHAVDGRVQAISGDTTLPKLGMLSDVYDRIGRECTHIVHCAAAVRMNLPIEAARQSAVTATQNVIALADACRDAGSLEKVELVSTVGVGGRLPGAIPERWITEPRSFHNTYEQAKAESEEFVAGRIAAGLPATVHRPSMVIGDARTGKIIHFQIFYHLAEFLSGRRTFGFFPEPGPTRLDLVPMDYVARAIVWSSERQDAVGKVFHLCSGPGASLPLLPLRERIRERFERAGTTLPRARTVSPVFFRAAIPVLKMLVSKKVRRALGTLPVFLDYLAERQEFSNTESTRVLSEAGIDLPSMSEAVDRSLDYYFAHRKER